MSIIPRHIKFYDIRDIDRLPQLQCLPAEERFAMRVVATVLPFRTNNYVVENLIDWHTIPSDPMYQLTFVQKDMLRPDHYEQVARLLRENASRSVLEHHIHAIRLELNPHPGGQKTANVPLLDTEAVPGVQHKYDDTGLVFPSQGQTCHAYCTYCFRWPQFVGKQQLKFATDETRRFERYLKLHTEIRDVLFTGGDPMIMHADLLARYIDPLLDREFEHIQTIRIGTKSVAYWPYRYVTDEDADALLRLFERVVQSGKHLAIMAHYNHVRELSTPIAQAAIQRIRSTGAVIRTQSPLIRHVNANATDWIAMWEEQVRLGCIPYYMFVARDTGANHYFSVPLSKVYQIFRDAYRKVSGLCRTVRGPCMSAYPGKVVIEGQATIAGEEVFVLSFLRARDPTWCKQPFFARFDEESVWFDQLRPAFNQSSFFFE